MPKKNVYIIKCSPYYKIGISDNLDKRLISLQIGNPFLLEKVLIINVNSTKEAQFLERQLHLDFEKKRVRGEWFALTVKDLVQLSIQYDGKFFCELEDLTDKSELNQVVEKVEKVSRKIKEKKAEIEAEQYSTKEIGNIWFEYSGYSINDKGIRDLRRWITKYGIDKTVDGIKTCCETYLQYDKSNIATRESAENAFSKIPVIIKSKEKQKENPYLKDFYYIRGILRNRFGNNANYGILEILESAFISGWSIDNLKNQAKESLSLWSFKESVSTAPIEY